VIQLFVSCPISFPLFAPQKKKKKNQFRKACVNPKKPLGMAAIYSLYIINKSGGLIFYKVRCLLPFNSITRAFWGVMLDWIMIESNTSD
jgi:hypothetical protein